MPAASPKKAVSRNHAVVREVARAWRSLTGGKSVRDDGRRTLIACSGGADSSALVLALAAAAGVKAGERLVVGHVVHDLRPRARAMADRDAARALAAGLGISFVEARVRVKRAGGNAEDAARRARYRALARLARGAGCRFVATAHHGDDQLETLVMRLVRGSGVRGMRGVHASRKLGNEVTLVRPMLGVTRADARELCGLAGWAWREDETNADCTRLRSAVRHEVLPAIERLRPRAGVRAAGLARQLGGLFLVLEERVSGVWEAGSPLPGGGRAWARGQLRGMLPVVLGELVRRGHAELVGAWGGQAFGTRGGFDRPSDPRVVGCSAAV
jgi:tRNA(Ile)-lysidine synthetase-like protein